MLPCWGGACAAAYGSGVDVLGMLPEGIRHVERQDERVRRERVELRVRDAADDSVGRLVVVDRCVVQTKAAARGHGVEHLERQADGKAVERVVHRDGRRRRLGIARDRRRDVVDADDVAAVGREGHGVRRVRARRERRRVVVRSQRRQRIVRRALHRHVGRVDRRLGAVVGRDARRQEASGIERHRVEVEAVARVSDVDERLAVFAHRVGMNAPLRTFVTCMSLSAATS